jgi:hypothetical protein
LTFTFVMVHIMHFVVIFQSRCSLLTFNKITYIKLLCKYLARDKITLISQEKFNVFFCGNFSGKRSMKEHEINRITKSYWIHTFNVIHRNLLERLGEPQVEPSDALYSFELSLFPNCDAFSVFVDGTILQQAWSLSV